MSVADPDRGPVTRPSWLLATACVVSSYLLVTFSHYTIGELSLDEATTFFLAIHPLRDLLTLPVATQGQPPLFFTALHGWLGFGDSEPVLRALPLVFMGGAALTLLWTAWLTPTTRIVALAALLLSEFSQYLTPTVRPYSLSVWCSLCSCLSLSSILRDPRRGALSYAWYVVSTVSLAYTVTVAVGTLLAQALCVAAAICITAAKSSLSLAIRRYWALVTSLAIVAALSAPHAIGVIRFQSALESSSLWVTVAAILNPRFYVSGPIYLLAMPVRLGGLALGLAVVGAWGGARDRDPLVAVLVTSAVVQVAMAHGVLAGRHGFSFRYLTPAYPALCLLVGLGADRVLAGRRQANVAVSACAALVLAAAIVVFVRAPHNAPVGPWRQVAEEFRHMPGAKIVFFDIGWDSQRLKYEVRHDPDVRLMADDGPGWDAFGRKMTPEYVARTIDQETAPGMLFFYHLDAVAGSPVFATTFVPAMTRHRCGKLYERAVPTYVRDDHDAVGARLYGYRCSGP